MITEALELLKAGRLTDPHAVLGAHACDGGVTIRAWRPEAQSVIAHLDMDARAARQKASGEGEEAPQRRQQTAQLGQTTRQLGQTTRQLERESAAEEPDSGLQVPLKQVADGIFEATIEGTSLPLRYVLDVRYPDGSRIHMRDPYTFPPTLGELDLHLLSEGRHRRLYDVLGAHVRVIDGTEGVSFAVWAPNACAVSVVGDFNLWDRRVHPMRCLGSSGVFELFLPGVKEGERYKFEIRNRHTGELRLKADPVALEAEMPPATASIVSVSRHEWADGEWMERRRERDPLTAPISIYEVHLGSWMRAADGGQPKAAELASALAAYVSDLGFTHVELLPVMAHPFSGSWGYQVTSYYAPSPTFGTPDELRLLIETLHRHDIGVILDWVPAHFPRDDWALARFDGTALYEHLDPRRGSHPDWGTLEFNYGRREVRNFLIANALFWLNEYHADGLRVDAVASMLYLDYSRGQGEWVANEHGGNEDLEAVAFLKELNELLHAESRGAISIAEESTAWPGVSRPTYLGGLGFTLKWNMGWMHDTLQYFSKDPVYRRYSHHQLTFSLMYAFSENFVLPLSHDEVVHGKGSLLSKMPGDRWQQLANLRALYAYMWAHPGKKLLFMGGELAAEQEWDHERSLPWDLLSRQEHQGVQRLVRDLNRIYRRTGALWRFDSDPKGFFWLEVNDADNNVLAFVRAGEELEGEGREAGGERRGARGEGERREARGEGESTRELLVCVCNLSPVIRNSYRVGLPAPGAWREILNTDSSLYGGSNVGNLGGCAAEPSPWHGQPHSAQLTLPPLAVMWLVPEAQAERC